VWKSLGGEQVYFVAKEKKGSRPEARHWWACEGLSKKNLSKTKFYRVVHGGRTSEVEQAGSVKGRIGPRLGDFD